MLDTKRMKDAYEDRAPFDVNTIEAEVSALTAERVGLVPGTSLRRYAAKADRSTDEPADPNLTKVEEPSTPTGPSEAGPDLVNHPPHYTNHPSGVECIQITEWMNFNCGNAVKYIWRADEKGATVEDLKKARWYLDREIARLEKLANG